MRLFTTQAEWREQVEQRDERIATLESEATARDEELAGVRAELASAREALAAAPTAEQLASLEADLATAQAAAAPEIIEAAALSLVEKGEAEPVQKAIAVHASAMLAAEGRAPIEAATPGEVSATPHLDKFESLSGSEATAYFHEHKKAIRREQAKKAGQ